MTIILTYATDHDLTAYARVTRVPNTQCIVIQMPGISREPAPTANVSIPDVSTLPTIPLTEDDLVTWEDAAWQ